MNITHNEAQLVSCFREADEDGRLFILELLACMAVCGEEFYNEAMAVREDGAALRKVVAKWADSVI